jgi:Lecithin:cholesterol acyltransferase
MSKTPVLFIPGLGGSFHLLVLLDWSGPTLSGWDFPPFVDYGKTFVDTMVHAGFTRNRDLFVAFYDWRKSVSDSANSYLISCRPCRWFTRVCPTAPWRRC